MNTDDAPRRENSLPPRILAAWSDADEAGREEILSSLARDEPQIAARLRHMARTEAVLASAAAEEAEDLASLEVRPEDRERMRRELDRSFPLARLRSTFLGLHRQRLGLGAAAGLLALLWLVLRRDPQPVRLDDPSLGSASGVVLIAPRDSVESWDGIEFVWSGVPDHVSHVEVLIEDPDTGRRQRSGPLRSDRWTPPPQLRRDWGDRILWTVEVESPGQDVPTGPPPISVRRSAR